MQLAKIESSMAAALYKVFKDKGFYHGYVSFPLHT